MAIQIYHHISVDQAGPERTEAGESAPSRLEVSPRPGRTKCELCETLQDLIMGAGEKASFNLPCLLILAPHPRCYLAFPFLFVGAAGDEGDPV